LAEARKRADILVLDDEPGVLTAVRRTLSAISDSVETTLDPHDALETLVRRPPKVLITDFRMPVMNGIEVLRVAQRVAPDTVRIMLSAYADKDVVAEAINSGRIFCFVAKPWDQEKLRSIVDQAISAHDTDLKRHRDYVEADRERRALRKAVDRVSAIQRSILPENRSRGADATAAWSYTPCEHASGDYVDTLALPEGRTALILGDVSGHGLGAAVFVFTARALLRTGLADELPLDMVLARTNRFLCNDMAEGRFLTLFIAIHDPETRTLTYVNAGHHPALVAHEGEMRELTRTALPLGIIEDASYAEIGTTSFEPGMTFFAYTDGVIEARRKDGELYGTERLNELLLREAAVDPGDLLTRVCDAVTDFVGGADAQDDLTLLAYRLAVPAEVVPD
jgi:sigma-B regulation protein RsbU (phosphoserine phosphatase)